MNIKTPQKLVLLVILSSLLFLYSCAGLSQPNRLPVVNAGSDQTTFVNTKVTLDGSSSSCPSGNRLYYGWVQTAGPSVTLSDPGNIKPIFTPTREETYTFQLIVNDGKLYSPPDYVTISVKQMNQSPISDAGSDQKADVGTKVTLDGSASHDPDGDRLFYGWNQTAGTSLVTLSDPGNIRPAFIPVKEGTYTFQLIVNDGKLYSPPDYVTISVNQMNSQPIADAGNHPTVTIDEEVILDGSESYDPDNDPLTYKWDQIDGPPVTLSNHADIRPQFTPGTVGEYRFQLIVNDGSLNSIPGFVTIKVNDGQITSEPARVIPQPGECPTETLGTFRHNGFRGTNVVRQSNGKNRLECWGYNMEIETSGELEVCIPAGYKLEGSIGGNAFKWVGLKKFSSYDYQFMSYLLRVNKGSIIQIKIKRLKKSSSDFIFIFHLYPPGKSPGVIKQATN